MPADLLQYAFSGLTVGAIYAIVALGFTLIYNASDVVNMAQGEFVMLGAMITIFLGAAGVPLPMAALAAIFITVAVGILLYGLAIDTARGADAITLIIITIGAAIFLRGVAQVVFDKRFHTLPAWVDAGPIQVGGATILPQSLIVLGGVAVLVLAFWLFMSKSIIGKAILATSANSLAATLVGIRVRSIIGITFAVSAAIGAIGGILIAPIAMTSYDAGLLLGLKAFASAMLGGIGSPIGAIVGGLLIGLAESFGAGLISSSYKDAIAFILLIAILFIKPNGLFGGGGVERV